MLERIFSRPNAYGSVRMRYFGDFIVDVFDDNLRNILYPTCVRCVVCRWHLQSSPLRSPHPFSFILLSEIESHTSVCIQLIISMISSFLLLHQRCSKYSPTNTNCIRFGITIATTTTQSEYTLSLSGLALALRTAAAAAPPPTTISASAPAAASASHYTRNQRIRRFNVERVLDDEVPTSLGAATARRESNVYTNLALGNCMDPLLDISNAGGNGASLPTTPGGSFRFTIDPSSPPPPPSFGMPPSGRMPSQGIPIPSGASRREPIAYPCVGMLSSPPMGRYYSSGAVASGIGGGLTPPLSSSPVYYGGGGGVGDGGAIGPHQYLNVYGTSGGSTMSLSRATTPQRAMMSAIAAADRRLGGFAHFVVVCCSCWSVVWRVCVFTFTVTYNNNVPSSCSV